MRRKKRAFANLPIVTASVSINGKRTSNTLNVRHTQLFSTCSHQRFQSKMMYKIS